MARIALPQRFPANLERVGDVRHLLQHAGALPAGLAPGWQPVIGWTGPGRRPFLQAGLQVGPEAGCQVAQAGFVAGGQHDELGPPHDRPDLEGRAVGLDHNVGVGPTRTERADPGAQRDAAPLDDRFAPLLRDPLGPEG